jgi:hypothetical protein
MGDNGEAASRRNDPVADGMRFGLDRHAELPGYGISGNDREGGRSWPGRRHEKKDYQKFVTHRSTGRSGTQRGVRSWLCNSGRWQADATPTMIGMNSPKWSRYLYHQLCV